MPKCSICQTSFSIFDVIKLQDGKCCPICWNKAAFGYRSRLLGQSKNMPSAQVKCEFDRVKAWEVAEKKIDAFFATKCGEFGIPHAEQHFYELTSKDYFRYCFDEKTLYQVESRYCYHNRYDSEIQTIADVDKLVPEKFAYLAIPIDQIEFYAKEGDVQYTTKISGGGGGGSSLSGAIIGGIVGGSAGAVIGSRQEAKPITSTTQTHDSRKTILKYHSDNGLTVIMFNGFDFFDFLQKHIPEKDLLSVQLQTTRATSQNGDIRETLKIIKGLFEDGLIDEAEYSKKRQELLKQI